MRRICLLVLILGFSIMVTLINCGIFVGEVFAQEKMYLRIGTGGVGGVWYPLGGGVADILKREIPNCVATAQATGASAENKRLFARKEIEIGFDDSFTGWNAFHGKGPFEGEPINNFRLIGPLYGAPGHIVTLKRFGIISLADLRGKKVAVGAPGSGTELYSRVVFPGLGLELKKDFDPVTIGYRPALDAIKGGRIHAIWQTGGLPMPFIAELAVAEDVIIFSMPKEKRDEIVNKYPTFYPVTIPAGTYKGQDKELITLEIRNTLSVREDLNDDLVYNITKAIYSEQGINYLKNVHKAVKDLSVEGAIEWAKTPYVPLHPGAERYYKELQGK